MCGPIFRLRQQSVGVIDTDFGTGIDAVLAFPELNQPCSAAIIEVDRKRVEYHLESGRHIIVEPGIPRGFLPGINGRRKEAAAAMIHITEGFRQFLQQGTFPALIHTLNSADNLLSAKVPKKHAQKGKQQ